MNYSQSLCYLESFLNYEHFLSRIAKRDLKLERMRWLLETFDHPEQHFFPVIIAGTKGKGSTGYLLESILRAAGISCGFYTSPHLETPRERIRIGGHNIRKDFWARELTFIRKKLSKEKRKSKRFGEITYFEIMTLMAALAFKRARVNIGIFEVGMGGRLDATNAMGAKVALLTPIDFDHEFFLGNTLSKIAAEKAAVIKKHSHVIVATQKKAATAVIYRQAQQEQATLYKVKGTQIPVKLPGAFQRMNAATAASAAEVLQKHYQFKINQRHVRLGLSQERWPGRLEILKKKLNWILDVAHNPAAMEVLTSHIIKKKIVVDTIIFGTASDKKLVPMLRSLSKICPSIILTRADNPRSFAVDLLLKEARHHFKEIWTSFSVNEALQMVRELVSSKKTVLVTGSFYLVGDIRKKIRKADA